MEEAFAIGEKVGIKTLSRMCNTEVFILYEVYLTDIMKGIILTTEVHSAPKMTFGLPKTVFTTSINL